MRRLLPIAVLLFAAACASPEPFSIAGQSVEAAASQQIEGAIADDFGMPLVATCPVVSGPAIGAEFICSASTSSGQVINFEGIVQGVDELDIAATNVVSGTALNEVRDQLAADLSASTGYEIAVECPTGMITMDTPVVTCLASTPAQPDASPINVTFTDPRLGSYRIDLAEFTIFNPAAKAVELIMTEFVAVVGVPLVPMCPEQIDARVGVEFRCTGETPDGRLVEFIGNVDRVRHIDMQTTNFLREEVVQAFEVTAAEALAPQTLTETTIDCQPRPVLFNGRGEVRCVLTLGNEDEARVALIKIEDFGTLAFTVAVETPEAAAASEDETAGIATDEEVGGA